MPGGTIEGALDFRVVKKTVVFTLALVDGTAPDPIVCGRIPTWVEFLDPIQRTD